MHQTLNFHPQTGLRQVAGVYCEIVRTVTDIARLVVGAPEDGAFGKVNRALKEVDILLARVWLTHRDLSCGYFLEYDMLVRGINPERVDESSPTGGFPGGAVCVASLRYQVEPTFLCKDDALGPYLSASITEATFLAYLGYCSRRRRNNLPLAAFVSAEGERWVYEAKPKGSGIMVERTPFGTPGHLLSAGTTLVLHA